MDWTKIIWAVLLGAMLVMIFPQAKHWVKNSPKGSTKDWMGFIVPMAAIVLFIVLLIALV